MIKKRMIYSIFFGIPGLLIAGLAALLVSGFAIGKRLETDPVMNKRHLLAATGVTILMVGLIGFTQWRAGNIGPKSDGSLCSEFCTRQGYSASSMPPRDSGEKTCGCLDHFGHETIKVPLDGIEQRKYSMAQIVVQKQQSPFLTGSGNQS